MSKAAWTSYLLLAAAVAATAGHSTRGTGSPEPRGTSPASTRPTTQPLRMTDVDGVPREPLALTDAPAAVFLFVATDCPISNSYAPEIIRICDRYGGETAGTFRFYLVYPDAELSPAAARTHLKEFGYTCPAFIDTHHELTKRFGPKVTPEAVVVGRDGSVLYRGRIDDKWAGYGRSRPEPTVRDLRAALDAIRAGKPVPARETEAIGCPI